MKGKDDIVYIATNSKDYGNIGEADFDILLDSPPKNGMIYKTFIAHHLVIDMLEKLRVVCGNGAMRYVEKEINRIKES